MLRRGAFRLGVAGFALAAIGLVFMVRDGASLGAVLFVVGGIATLAAALVTDRAVGRGWRLAPVVVLLSAFGAMGVDAAVASRGASIVTPALAAAACLALAAWFAWHMIQRERGA